MIKWLFLDYLFLTFHSLLIIFNLFGWIYKPVRIWNLFTLVLTGLSWFVLGIFYGIGFCPLTDWHWKVLAKLGYSNLPNSYVSYLFERLLGLHVESQIVESLTVGLFFLALVFSIIFNYFSYQKRRIQKQKI